MLPASQIDLLQRLDDVLLSLWKGPTQTLYANAQQAQTSTPSGAIDLRFNTTWPVYNLTHYTSAVFHLTGGSDPLNATLACTLQTYGADSPNGPWLIIPDGRGLQVAASNGLAYDNGVGKPYLWVSLSGIAFLVTPNDLAIASGSAILSAATPRFTAADVGKAITIQGAGVAGAALVTTISSASISVSDGSITSTMTTLTSATGPFVAGDVGSVVTITGAGPAGGVLTTRITVYNSATSVTVADAASTTVAGTGVITYQSAYQVTLAATASTSVASGGVGSWSPTVTQGFHLTATGYNGGGGSGRSGLPTSFADITVTTTPQPLPSGAAGSYQLNNDSGSASPILYGDSVRQTIPIPTGLNQTLTVANPNLIWVKTSSSTATLHMLGFS